MSKFEEVMATLNDSQKELVTIVSYDLVSRADVVKTLDAEQKDAFVSLIAKIVEEDISFNE